MNAIYCPECGVKNPVEAAVCERCNADLLAIKSIMDTANTHYNEALSMAHTGRLDEALAQIEAALALSAHNPEYHNLQGTIYGQKGLYNEAMRAWERCFSLDPEMEKAYRNIDKARKMESDIEEEQRKRPFLTATIVASCIAGILLLLTVYFGLKTYYSSATIKSKQIVIDTKTKEISNLNLKNKELNEKFPEGVESVLNKVNQLQTQATERQNQIDMLTKQKQTDSESYNQQLTLLRNQVQSLQQDKKNMEDQLQAANVLRAKLSSLEGKEESSQRTIQERTNALKVAYEDRDNLTKRVAAALEEVKDTRQKRDQAIYDLKQQHSASEEKFRTEIQNLRDQIAALERKAADKKYADGLIAEALRNTQDNKFQQAYQNVQDALARDNSHALGISMREDLEKIINDPLEQEMRRQSTTDKDAQRIQKKNELIITSLAKAKQYLAGGSYDKAIETAERVAALSPAAKEKAQSQQIISEAQEKNRQITVLLLEAKKNIEDNKTKEADAILKKIIKLSPENEQASALLKQLSSK